MTITGNDEAWASVRAADLTRMNRNDVVVMLGCAKRARAHLDAFEIRAVRRLRELQACGAAEEPAVAIAGASGRSNRDAEAVTNRDQVCLDMPAIESALDDGSISAGHVDAIAAAANRLPAELRDEFNAQADDLLRRAGQVSLDQFGRECRDLAKQVVARSRTAGDADELEAQRAASKVSRWVDRITGMHHTMLELDPLRDATLSSAVNAEIARMRQVDGNGDLSWQQLQVHAWVAVITGATTSAPRRGESEHDPDDPCHCGIIDRVPEVAVLIDHRSLSSGARAGGVCETENGVPLPVSTVRRLCCDAEVLPVILGADGVVLDQGRSKRTATRAQRRALRAMHRGCVHPQCTVGFDACRIHHIEFWWEHHGQTNLDNLVPLCERHHHSVHEGGWTLTMTPGRVASWHRPDGSHHHTGTTIDRQIGTVGRRPDPTGTMPSTPAGLSPSPSRSPGLKRTPTAARNPQRALDPIPAPDPAPAPAPAPDPVPDQRRTFRAGP